MKFRFKLLAAIFTLYSTPVMAAGNAPEEANAQSDDMRSHAMKTGMLATVSDETTDYLSVDEDDRIASESEDARGRTMKKRLGKTATPQPSQSTRDYLSVDEDTRIAAEQSAPKALDDFSDVKPEAPEDNNNQPGIYACTLPYEGPNLKDVRAGMVIRAACENLKKNPFQRKPRRT